MGGTLTRMIGRPSSAVASWNAATLPALNVQSTGWANFTIRQNIRTSIIPAGSWSLVRFSFRGGSTEAITITKCYIQLLTVGDAFTTTPIQVLWNGGSTSAVIGINTTLMCDTVTLAIPAGTDVGVNAYTSAGAGAADNYEANTLGGSGSSTPSHFISGDSAISTSLAGFTANGNQLHFDDFEVSL